MPSPDVPYSPDSIRTINYMRLIKLPIICSAALMLVAASAADNKDNQSSGKDSSAQASAAKAAEGTVDLTVSGMR